MSHLVVAVVGLLAGGAAGWLVARRRAGDAAQARAMLQLVLDTIPMGVLWKDRASRYLGCNAVVARAMSLPGPAAVVGMTDADFPSITPAQAAFFVAKDREVMEAGVPLLHIHEPMTLPAGGTVWLDTNKVPIRDAAGAVTGLLVTWEDVTDRRRLAGELDAARADLEERVRVRTAELEAANKELEAFSYSVSHDLRAPLRAVDGFARILQRDHAAALPPAGGELLADVRAAAARMNRLIDDLLAFSRLGRRAVRRRPVDVTALVRRCLAELPAPAGRRVEWHVAELPPADADPALLKQVWLNLLGNALKYTGPRDPAVVTVGGDPAGPTYTVRDNGVGFDMAHAGGLFGVFRRLHRADEFEGTGVGLAVVRRVVERHGGRVWADAEPGRGAAFSFTLPPAPAQPSAVADTMPAGGAAGPAPPPAGRTSSEDYDG